MKNFAKLFVLLAVLILPNFAFAAEKNYITLYDASLTDFFNNMKTLGEQVDVNIFQIDYEKQDKIIVGTAHFGNDSENVIYSLADNKFSPPANVIVTFSTSEDSATQAGAVLSMVLVLSGFSEDEYEDFTEQISEDMEDIDDEVSEKYQIWCEAAQRYIEIVAYITAEKGVFTVMACEQPSTKVAGF